MLVYSDANIMTSSSRCIPLVDSKDMFYYSKFYYAFLWRVRVKIKAVSMLELTRILTTTTTNNTNRNIYIYMI